MSTLEIIKAVLAALAQWLKLKTAQAQGEREKREAIEDEAQALKAQADAAVDVAGDRLRPGALSERVRAGKL